MASGPTTLQPQPSAASVPHKPASLCPRLAGRLVKSKSKSGHAVRLDHPAHPSAEEIDRLFTVTSATDSAAFKLSSSASYVDICKSMYKSKTVVVDCGSALVGKDKPVAQVTLAESATKGEFALIFSVSHSVADGRTYYDVFKMLQPGGAVRALASTRVQSFSEAMRDKCGRREIEWADSAAAGVLFVGGALKSALGCGGGKAQCHAFSLDAERVAKAKAAGAAEGGVEYVTTNDVLTSAFLSVCGSRIGWMGFDCRGKVEGVGPDLAGNYVTALVLGPEVFGTPADLRRMYAEVPYVTTKRPLPGPCECSSTFAQVSNWASFAGELVQLEGCELVIHLPALNPAYATMGGADQMVPFSYGVGKKGVLCWVVNTNEAALREALPVGGTVSEKLFPPV